MMAAAAPAAPDTPQAVPLALIDWARSIVARDVERTVLLRSGTAAGWIRERAGVAVGGDTVFFKPEHLQKTGSFKPRATVARLAALSTDERRRGVITVSAGNAGAAYAWAGSRLGIHTTVVMPEAAVRTKVDACRAYGAEVILHGADAGQATDRMLELRDERNLILTHPFNDPYVIAGNASIGFEILEDLPDVDVVVVPVGGGGLIGGIATALKEHRPGVAIYGVEPETSDCLRAALAAGEIVRVHPASIAEGLAAVRTGEWNLPTAQRYVDEVVLVDDDAIREAMRFALERMKQLLEPAGAVGLAAVLSGAVPLRAGQRICVVLSGGNVDVGTIGNLLEGGAVSPAPAAPRAE